MGYDMDRCHELFNFMFGVRHDFVYHREPDWTAKLCKGRISIKDFFMHVVGMMKQRRRQDHHCIATGFLWHTMSASIFVEKSTKELNTRLLALFQDSERLGLMAWGVGNLGHASRGMIVGISGCTYLNQMWIWQYFMYFSGILNPVPSTEDYQRRAHQYHIDQTHLQTMKNAIYYRHILDEYRPEDVGSLDAIWIYHFLAAVSSVEVPRAYTVHGYIRALYARQGCAAIRSSTVDVEC
ncbi:hypothetical protein V2J09_011350 [Rumex salicifolius]